MKLKERVIKNTSAVDMFVTDAYGVTYTIFPSKEKSLLLFVEEKKGEQCGSNSAGESGVRKGK